MHDEHVGHLPSVRLASLLIGGKRVAACLHAHFPKCRQRRVPAAWSRDLCEEPVTFRGLVCLLLPETPPMSVKVRVAACLHAHFPKCRHRRVPAAWSGDLCEEPVTFRGSSEDFREGVEAFGAKRKPRFRGNDAWRGDSRSLRGVAADGDREFESISLQRRVRLSPRAAVAGREPRLSARLCGAGLATGSAERRMVFEDSAYRRQYLCRAIFQYRSAADGVGENATPVPIKSGVRRSLIVQWTSALGPGSTKAQHDPLIMPGKRQA
jgi:hypothetical protein